MKKLLITTLTCLMVLGISTTARAVLLPLGGSFLPTGVASPGAAGVPLYTTTVNYLTSSGKALGIFTQNVRNSTGNAGWIVYEYLFSSSNASTTDIIRLSSIDFGNFAINADAIGVSVAPLAITRDSFGSTVGANYLLHPNNTTNLLWFEVNSPYIGLGHSYIQNGGQADIVTWCPVIPEPTSMALLGLGVLGLFGLRKKIA